MLKDRLALIEHEIDKLKAACAYTYLESIKTPPTHEDKKRYEEMQVKLNSLCNDELLIKDILKNGFLE